MWDVDVASFVHVAEVSTTGRLFYGTEAGHLKHERRTWALHRNAILDFELAGDTIVTASADHSVKLYDLAKESTTFEMHRHETSVKSVSLAGNRGVSADRDGRIVVFDVREDTRRCFRELHARRDTHARGVSCVVQLDDCILSAGATDGILKVWDLRIMHEFHVAFELARLEGTRGIIHMCLNEDYIFVSRRCRCICVYDKSALLCGKCQEPVRTLSGPALSSYHNKMCCSSSRLACGSSDGNVYIWNLATFSRTVIRGYASALCCTEEGLCTLFDEVTLSTYYVD